MSNANSYAVVSVKLESLWWNLGHLRHELLVFLKRLHEGVRVGSLELSDFLVTLEVPERVRRSV
jgi:hypothetical protein